MKSNRIILLFFILLLTQPKLFSQKVEFNGQISALHLSKIENPWQSVTGIRYIPEIKWHQPITKTWNFDLEASVNAYSHLDIKLPDSISGDFSFKPYRVIGKLASERFELRLGLQKISFGSAAMLRPLMWFDHMDPRDPLQLTDGVYAVLGRYFFQNNANIWLWGILPGKTTKGWESVTSDRKRPEFGGRIQLPAGKGELALSGHFRYIGAQQSIWGTQVNQNPIPEYRMGLDGKWDIGPGVWFEGTYTYSKIPVINMRHIRMLTLGTDYTFGLGNGLTAMAEQFFYQMGPEIFNNSTQMTFTAASLTYPISLTHSLSAMVFYQWSAKNWYRFINWTINLNKISLHLIAFWNPDSFDLYQNTGNSNLMGGKGIQLLFVWNH